MENYLKGTRFNDILSTKDGTSVSGKGGNDAIYGFYRFEDYLNGNDGNDSIWGSGGDDTIIGGKGDDLISGGSGNDSLIGNKGADRLIAGANDDTLTGGGGDDTLVAGFTENVARQDVLIGGSGGDTFDLTSVFESHIVEGVSDFKPDKAIIKDFDPQEDTLRLYRDSIGGQEVDYSYSTKGNDVMISANIENQEIPIALLEKPQLT